MTQKYTVSAIDLLENFKTKSVHFESHPFRTPMTVSATIALWLELHFIRVFLCPVI